MDTINSKMLDKKVWVNKYLNNYGEVNYLQLYQNFIFYFVIFFNSIIFSLIILNQLANNGSLDYYVITGIYTHQIVLIMKYFVINTLGAINDLIDILNFAIKLLNDNLHTNYNLIHFTMKQQSLDLNIGSYISIFSSLVFIVLFHFLTFLQSRYQLILRYSSIITYYVSILFLFSWWNRFKNGYVYVKLINKLRDMNLNQEHKKKIVQKVFKKDIEAYDIEFIEMDFLGFYHFTKLQLILKEQKQTKQSTTRETNETNTKKNIQNNKRSRKEAIKNYNFE